ncbi:serine protease [Streptomyces sp. LP11]|uniref:Serine protease n=1 Tax=Streptomyces pyxinicus TaxID=2970331 RepID=A0ABT2AVM7_9ACTN|nr:serine protease [Streptomyces sp. LP11]MCS0599748.1 serine protease [Streptomyces sp. LP11]
MSPRTLIRGLLTTVLLGGAALAAPAATAHAVPAPETTAAPVTGGVRPIVGGGQASENYSFMASLQQQGRHHCGGSLIAAQWIVTAAHCATSQQGGQTPAQQIQVHIGSADYTQGTTASVQRVIRHPRYSGDPTGNYDIALLQLRTPVRNQPVTIAADSPSEGTATRLLGWGQTCPQQGCSQQPPRNLKELDTRINPDRMCAGGFNAASELCVYGTPQATACYGDSGGPALVGNSGSWQLVGATSRAGQDGSTCGTGNSTIYTDVTAYRQWISQNTGGALLRS